MNKLSKPKAFEASPNSIKVMFGNQEVECTNLTRSAIMVQTVVLVAHEQKWHEIEIADLGLDSVHLPSFKHHIESNRLTLSDLALAPEVVSYELQHDDFIALQTEFPAYDYIQIAKLHEYEKRSGLPCSKFDKRITLRMLTDKKLSISDYIRDIESRKHAIIGETAEYADVVDESKLQLSIISETVEAPALQAVPTDSVSLQIFEKLTPEKITELQGLKITQEAIVKANPVVIIKDKKTYAEAKKTAAILLSASTAIDGSKGVEATATKYLNTFKTMLKTALLPIAKLTREPYDKQKKLIEDWDNRLLLQAQNRVKELFSVPFTYNSETDSYSVGSLIITQKDIEEKNDTDFAALVAQGKAIIIALESVKNEQDSKIAAQEKQIAELKAMIEKLLPAQSIKGIEKGIYSHVSSGEENNHIQELDSEIKLSNDYVNNEVNPFTPVSTQSIVDHQNSSRNFVAEAKTLVTEYQLPHPDNKLLNDLDLAHASVLEEKQYIECREYYKQGLSDAADAINDILVNPDKTIQKSVAITELIKTWKL